MSRTSVPANLITNLQHQGIPVRYESVSELASVGLLRIDGRDWCRAAQVMHAEDCRWAAGWGDHNRSEIRVFSCFEAAGHYVVLETRVEPSSPVLPSQSPVYAIADRSERHTRDLLGVNFVDALDARRWLRHQAWDENTFPLRNDFPLAGQPAKLTAPDGDYPFQTIAGSGVYEIPVGPVHAGIIEPGHFRFNAVGEDVLSLEEHLGYVHKGIEKLAVGRRPEALARLAGRVSGDSTVAHSWAACMAMERAVDCEVPVRASELRALMCERERVANHLGDIGAICNDVGFAFANVQCSRLRENWQRQSARLSGHRMMMDCITPGGVSFDFDQSAIASLLDEHAAVREETTGLFDRLQDIPSLEDRLLKTGFLSAETARVFGCTGYVGKASGLGFDVRSAHPYPPYDRYTVEVPHLQAGDVMARMQLRMQEVHASLNWMDRVLTNVSDGPIHVDWPNAGGPVSGVGLVEGWRGEILVYVRLDEDARVARYFPRDPSWNHWPALERIVPGNVVPDFPVCNKSVNGSYSGTDL